MQLAPVFIVNSIRLAHECTLLGNPEQKQISEPYFWNHLIVKQAVQDLFMEEQVLACQLQKLIEKWAVSIKFGKREKCRNHIHGTAPIPISVDKEVRGRKPEDGMYQSEGMRILWPKTMN